VNMQLTKKSPRVLFQVLAFFLTFLASKVKSDHEGSSDPLDWLRDAIPGEPGVDYPILAFVGDTSFSCADRVFGGYYADPELQCQGYHVCLTPPNAATDRKTSFLCPNGTVFNQQLLTCDWWFNFDCSEAEDFYSVNDLLGSEEPLANDDSSLSASNQQVPTQSNNQGSPLPPDQRTADPIVRQQQATSQQKPKRRRKQKPKAQNGQKRPNGRRKGQKKPKPDQRTQTAGVSSSSILPSDFGEQRPRQQQPQFDIVQYDATIPDDDSEDIPILLADPFRDFIDEIEEYEYDQDQDQQANPISTLYGAPIGPPLPPDERQQQGTYL